jgi:NitT/TauT family transport system substrate-binding protein
MSIKRGIWLIVVAAVLTSGIAEAQEKVSIRLKWLHQAQFAGYYVAKEKGFYKEEGLDVTINPGGPQLVAENLVAAGTDDFAQGGGMETTLAGRDKGLPLVAIAAVFPKTPVLLVAKKESGITKLEHFSGKKVSMWYTGTQYIVRAMLKNAGVDPAKITEVPQPVTMAPFVRGEVDVACVTVFNELQTLITEGVKDLVLFDPADYGIVIPRDTIVTTEKTIKERPQVVQRFLRASLRGWKYAIENQPEAVDITLKQSPNLKKEHQTIMLREVAKLMTWGPSKEQGLGYLDPKTAEFTMNFLLENKQLTKAIPLSEATNTRFWSEVPASLKVVR